MKVNFQALGCRLNEAELDSWSRQFLQRGHELTMNSNDADLVIFNSCSVTSEADRKSRKLINRLHRENPAAELVVTGCYASLQTDAVSQQLGVDLVVDNRDKDKLVDVVVDRLRIDDGDSHLQAEHSIFTRGRHRAFIKVQDGCRYRCTYCVVTLARGEEHSRSIKTVIEEINYHHQQGVQEIVLTGVHVGGYGSDSGSSLYRLLAEILERTSIPRIRLASVEPWDLPDNFFDLFLDQRLMPHMHLPLQSGSDSVLRRMARRCKTAEFERLVELARKTIPLFNVTTDVIVGFPGETEQEWLDTMRFVERIGFGDMHIFSFSPRSGTKAAGLANQVESAIKKQRSQQMHTLARELKLKELRKHVGYTYPVLWEKSVNLDGSRRVGYIPQYHRIVSDAVTVDDPAASHATVDTINEEQLVLCQAGTPGTVEFNASLGN